MLSDGHEVIEVSPPVIVTVSNELDELRSANLREADGGSKDADNDPGCSGSWF